MSNLKKTFLKIYRENKSLLALMTLLFLSSIFVFIYTIVSINPSAAVMKIGYGDIGGYRDGAWTNMLTFPFFALVLGILHNFLGMKIFEKYGGGIAKIFIFTSLMLIIGIFVVFLRLLGES